MTEVVTVEHVGGDNLDESTINISVNDLQAYNGSSEQIWSGSGEINSSARARVVGYNAGDQALQEGDEIEIIWAGEDNSAVLRRYTVE